MKNILTYLLQNKNIAGRIYTMLTGLIWSGSVGQRSAGYGRATTGSAGSG
jgi:hypothetical protein